MFKVRLKEETRSLQGIQHILFWFAPVTPSSVSNRQSDIMIRRFCWAGQGLGKTGA